MRHKSKGKKLGRPFQPRMAMLKNMVISLLQYEKIVTTEPKAKELKRMTDRLLAKAKTNDIAARRGLIAFLFNNAKVVDKIYTVLMPRFDKQKSGGYTRIYKLGIRPGDGTPTVQIELT
jgi:large subunit ribosomal protein L17